MSRRSVQISATQVQNTTVFRVTGSIDEKFDPSAFAGRRGVVVFDLGGVERITSNGVLQWITALKSLDAVYYCFVNCRPCMVDQFNLVHGFGQRGELISFFARFACRDCGQEVDRLIDLRDDFELVEDLRPPDARCPKCGGAAEFDELPEMYFRHVRSSPPPRPPPAASDAIGGSERRGALRSRRFEMTKDVDQSVTAFWLSGFLDHDRYFKRAADGVDGVAILEVGDLDGISSEGIAGLAKFLKRLDGAAVFARVTAGLIEPLAELVAEKPRLEVAIASFLVPLHCTGCRKDLGADIPADRVLDLVAGRTAENCPSCLHPLDVQWSIELATRAVTALPIATAPTEVQSYLRSHLPTARNAMGDRLASSVDPQRLLLGRYKILQPLGRGGMGEVFLARQLGPESFEKLVVLKRVRRDRLGEVQSRELFLQEARLAARVSHHNVVQIFDLEQLEDEYLISMEYVNGIDLGRALQLSRELRLLWPIEICCRVIAELCSALHAAHTYSDDEGRPSPIIHCDVSPSNILLSTEGQVKLADFGIARVASDPTGDATRRGKAGYAAPEQCEGGTGRTDARTDIYAAGVVLFECLTLRPIYADPTLGPGPRLTGRDRLRSTFTAPNPGWRPASPPQICVARSGAPPLLQDVFERAIQPDPEQRYRNARDLGRDVERIGRLVAETATEDLALWFRRLVALRLESEGHVAPPIVTLSGSLVGSVPLAGDSRK